MAKMAGEPMPWLKLWHNFLDNPKAQRVAPALRGHYINLLCVACRENAKGRLPSVEKTAFMIRLSEQDTVSTLNSLVEAGLIETRARLYWIHDWEQWQERKSDAAVRQQRVRDKRNALRNGHSDELRNDLVTCSATRSRARSASASNSPSNSQEGGAGGNPPADVAKLAARTEARWPAQNADVFVGDLCKTFDVRLAGQILEQAYDKDPKKLPRAWIRSGCQAEMARGWHAPAEPVSGIPGPVTGKLSPEMEARVQAWEAEQDAAKRVKGKS